MFVYLLRFILIFWIISILVRWVERFFTAARPEPRRDPSPPRHPVNAPPDLDVAGTIVDADFVELDGDE